MPNLILRRSTLALLLVVALASPAAWGQEPPPPTPAPPPPAAPAPAPPPTPAEAAAAAPAAPAEAPPLGAGKGGLRIHVITTRQTYEAMVYDVFHVESERMVGTGRGVIESSGEEPQLWELDPGVYKIVRAGEPLATRADFATVQVEPGRVTDFVIVVDS